MSDPALDCIEVVMGEMHPENSEESQEQVEETDVKNHWGDENIVLQDPELEGDGDSGGDSNIDSVREEIKAALLTGQKTITLSADDASLEAKILEIVRQSRHLEQNNGSQQQYIEIVNEDGHVASRILGTEIEENQGDNQRVVEIDLMNFKLVRYQDEEGAEGDASGIRGLVMAEHEDSDGQQYIQITNGEDGTSSDHDAVHYIQSSQHAPEGVQYVQVIEKDKVPMVYFTTEQSKIHHPINTTTSSMTLGKRKRGEFILHPDTMNSPNFKLFLYNCKLCDFKCNAIKELTAHKAMHPGIGAGRYRSLAKPPSEKALSEKSMSVKSISEKFISEKPIRDKSMRDKSMIDIGPLALSSLKQYDVEYCGQCEYKTVSKTHLQKHMSRCHSSNSKTTNNEDFAKHKQINTFERYTTEGNVTVYICKKCDFKTENKGLLRTHKCHEDEVQEFALN